MNLQMNFEKCNMFAKLCCRQIQHIIFIPACMIGGRLDAIIGSYKDEKEFRLGVYFGLEQNVSEATLQAPVVQMANFSTLAEDP